MIEIRPIAYVTSTRSEAKDDFWGAETSVIELAEDIPAEALQGIETFSHIEIIFYFHQAKEPYVFINHPRGNREWPEVGIFAQRRKDRPNRLGITMAELVKHEGRRLYVKHLDAIDGTPVIDIKPIMKDMLIDKAAIREPKWAGELMKDYWK